MQLDHIKPKLVFFQYRYDEKLPEFLLIHTRDHVRCLSEFFDVVVINEDSDYQAVCERHQPDMVLFESGVSQTTCRKPKVVNIEGCPDVPRAALHNADAFCNARAGFLSDIDHLGIETIFAISTTAAEHTPEMSRNLFVWPNSINPEIYRDYRQWKSIPVLFSGNKTMLYPWRQKILRQVAERYPALVCPHPGYDPGAAAAQVMCGEPYARMINAAITAAACGTVAKEVVRKHFEIPACNTCLITERSAALEAAGFVDMENCVFADEADILDKLGYLFQNRSELHRITENGYRLVHSRHTFRQRDQIFQWYCLQKYLLPNQRIVQDSPFGQLSIVDDKSIVTSAHLNGEGLHISLVRDGDRLFERGDYDLAARSYLRCMNYIGWMPEARFGFARCKLYQGDARTSRSWLIELLRFTLDKYQAVDPDPVEWSYYILSLLCSGKLKPADRAAHEFGWLRHPELDRIRWVVASLTHRSSVSQPSDGKPRATIHRLETKGWSEWLASVCVALRACGQSGLAERLSGSVSYRQSDESLSSAVKNHGPVAIPSAARAGVPPRERFKSPLSRSRSVLLSLQRRVAHLLHEAERRYGYFLPYRLSAMKTDEPLFLIRELARTQRVRTALVLGISPTRRTADALLAGLSEAPDDARVFCLSDLTSQFRRFKKAFDGRIECHAVKISGSEGLWNDVGNAARKLKNDHGFAEWDAVLLDNSMFHRRPDACPKLESILGRARVIIIDGIDSIQSFEQFERLREDSEYVLVGHDPARGRGYAMFRLLHSTISTASDHVLNSPLQRV